MEPAQGDRVNDEFGYQRFALTESAYDLVNSLIGIYARSCFRDPQNPAVSVWKQRLDELHALRHTADWSDLSFLQQTINQLSTEYKQAAQIEAEQQIYATAQSRAIHPA